MSEILEDIKNKMAGINQMMNAAIDAPLKRGLMDKATHDLYKKDMFQYIDLLQQGRTTEADTFLQKIITKYDKPKTEDAV